MLIVPGMDLRPVVEQALLATLNDRADTQYAHASDAYRCDLETWARRNGMPMLPKSTATAWKLALGHDVEARVAAGMLVETLGGGLHVERNERFAWNPYTMEVRRHLLPPLHSDVLPSIICRGCFDCMPQANETIGHTDLNFEDRIVGEVKSVWFGVKPPVECNPHYIIQTAQYAVPIRAEDFFIIILAVTLRGRKTAIELAETFWFKTADYYDAAVARAKEVIERTAAGVFPPPANPQWGWLCKVCGYGECGLNINPDKDAIAHE